MTSFQLTGDVSPVNIDVDTDISFEQTNMRPQLTDRNIYAGDTTTFNFTVKESGVAKNLAGLSLSFAAATSVSPSEYLFNVTPTAVDNTAGTATVTLTAAQTSVAGDYTAEVTVWGSGVKITALQFPLIVNDTVA